MAVPTEIINEIIAYGPHDWLYTTKQHHAHAISIVVAQLSPLRVSNLFYYGCRKNVTLLQLLIRAHPPPDGILISAVQRNRLAAAAVLLADPRVDPTVDGNEALNTAVRCNFPEMVSLLLSDPRVDPNTVEDSVLLASFNFPNEDAVIALLSDPRFVATDALYDRAERNECFRVVTALEPDVQKRVVHIPCLERVAENGLVRLRGPIRNLRVYSQYGELLTATLKDDFGIQIPATTDAPNRVVREIGFIDPQYADVQDMSQFHAIFVWTPYDPTLLDWRASIVTYDRINIAMSTASGTILRFSD